MPTLIEKLSQLHWTHPAIADFITHRLMLGWSEEKVAMAAARAAEENPGVWLPAIKMADDPTGLFSGKLMGGLPKVVPSLDQVPKTQWASEPLPTPEVKPSPSSVQSIPDSSDTYGPTFGGGYQKGEGSFLGKLFNGSAKTPSNLIGQTPNNLKLNRLEAVPEERKIEPSMAEGQTWLDSHPSVPVKPQQTFDPQAIRQDYLERSRQLQQSPEAATTNAQKIREYNYLADEASRLKDPISEQALRQRLPDTLREEAPLKADTKPLEYAAYTAMPWLSGAGALASALRGAAPIAGEAGGGAAGSWIGKHTGIGEQTGNILGSIAGGLGGFHAGGIGAGAMRPGWVAPRGGFAPLKVEPTVKNPLYRPGEPISAPNAPGSQMRPGEQLGGDFNARGGEQPPSMLGSRKPQYPFGPKPETAPVTEPVKPHINYDLEPKPGEYGAVNPGTTPASPVESGAVNPSPVDGVAGKPVSEPLTTPATQQGWFARRLQNIRDAANLSRRTDPWSTMGTKRLLGSTPVDPTRPIFEGAANALGSYSPVAGEALRYGSRAVLAPGRFLTGAGPFGQLYAAAAGKGAPGLARYAMPFASLTGTGLGMSILYPRNPNDKNEGHVSPIPGAMAPDYLGNYGRYYSSLNGPGQFAHDMVHPLTKGEEIAENVAPGLYNKLTKKSPSELADYVTERGVAGFQAGFGGRPLSVDEQAQRDAKQEVGNAQRLLASNQPGQTPAPGSVNPAAAPTPAVPTTHPAVNQTLQMVDQKLNSLMSQKSINGALPEQIAGQARQWASVKQMLGASGKNIPELMKRYNINDLRAFDEALNNPTHPIHHDAVLQIWKDPTARAELEKMVPRTTTGDYTRETYNKEYQASLGIWESLPTWSKALFVGGVSLSAIGLLSSLFGGDDDDEEHRHHGGSSWLGPLAGVGGLGAAAFGITGGQPGRWGDPTFRNDLWSTAKQPFANMGR